MHFLVIFVSLVSLGRLNTVEVTGNDYNINKGFHGKNQNKNVKVEEPTSSFSGEGVHFSAAKVELFNGKNSLPTGEVDLYGGKLDLKMAQVDLIGGKIDLTMAKLDLSRGMDKKNLPQCKAKLPAAKADLFGVKNDLKIEMPSRFTYCFAVKLSANGRQEPLLISKHAAELNELLSDKDKFSIKITNGGSRLILENYLKEFGSSLAWIDKPAECCISWEHSTKVFRLYLEGELIISGTGYIEWGLVDRIEDVVLEEQTRQAVSGAMTEIMQWNYVLSKAEVQQVAAGNLKRSIIKRKNLNWKITANKITESFQPSSTIVSELSSGTLADKSTAEMAAESETTTEYITELSTESETTELTTEMTTEIVTTELTTEMATEIEATTELTTEMTTKSEPTTELPTEMTTEIDTTTEPTTEGNKTEIKPKKPLKPRTTRAPRCTPLKRNLTSPLDKVKCNDDVQGCTLVARLNRKNNFILRDYPFCAWIYANLTLIHKTLSNFIYLCETTKNFASFRLLFGVGGVFGVDIGGIVRIIRGNKIKSGWQYLCVMWRSSTGELQVYHDGVLIFNETGFRAKYFLGKNCGFYLLQTQYGPNDDGTSTKGVGFKAVEYKVWSKIRTSTKVRSMYCKRTTVDGSPVLNSRSVKWTPITLEDIGLSKASLEQPLSDEEPQ